MPIFSWEYRILEIVKQFPQSGWFYQFMFYSSEYSSYIYLITALLLFFIWKQGVKKTILPILMCGLVLVASEIISRRIIKIIVMRPRPRFVGLECHMTSCWGFISSHTTTFFGLALYLSLYDKKNLLWTMPIAIFIAFSRIYLLDHFPLDVICGALFGSCIGYVVWKISKYAKFIMLDFFLFIKK